MRIQIKIFMKSRTIFTFFFLLLSLTRAAPSNLSLRLSPTSLKFAIVFQQILTEHDPLTPWHLHKSFILLLIACNKLSFTMCHYQKQQTDPTIIKLVHTSSNQLHQQISTCRLFLKRMFHNHIKYVLVNFKLIHVIWLMFDKSNKWKPRLTA